MRRTLSEPAMERLIGLVQRLDELEDARVLTKALVGQ
jgi:hypothetical protein